jgi:geranylgeranyl diphosphate synthase, type II
VKFETYYSRYIPWFGEHLKDSVRRDTPSSLYEPVRYVLQHSGKQLRPAILSATAQVFGDTPKEKSLPASLCIEMIHNFTLIHDDIMDADILRHGQQTVHEKWDTNRAILAGDGLFAIALDMIRSFRSSPETYSAIMPLILDAVIRVCEGQAMDMEFEERDDVSVDEYIVMVTKKTAYLLAVAGRIGAFLGGATEAEQKIVENILLETGIMFQIQDDLLELTAGSAEMGKTLGSDLIKEKKTYPYLYAKQELSAEIWEEFLNMIREEVIEKKGIEPACRILEENFIFDKIQKMIKIRHDAIQDMIRELPVRTQQMFQSMLSFIMNRKN